MQAPALQPICESCPLYELCISLGLDELDIAPQPIITKPGPIASKTHLFRVGDRFENVYAVRSGGFKCYTVDRDGRDNVVGFCLPGELLGLDGIHCGIHECNAVAMQTTRICGIPYQKLFEFARSIPELQRDLFELMSRNIYGGLSASNWMSAEQRVASFLVDLSERNRRTGHTHVDLVLAMSRDDIGSYVGLATETVSRVMTRLRQNRVIETHGRSVRLLDIERLRALAGLERQESAPLPFQTAG